MFKNASKYNEINVLAKNTGKEVMKEYHKYIKYGEKNLILDVGSGSGNVVADVLLPCIPNSNFSLICVDIMKSMVDFATNYVKDSRVSFRVLDMAEKNEDKLKSVFSREELNPGFDIVFSFACLMFSSDHEQFLKNIFSLLRPGGQALIWFIAHYTLSDVWQSVRNMEKWQVYLKDQPILIFPYHDSIDVKSECTNLLKRIGFQDIICDCVKKTLSDVIDTSEARQKHINFSLPYLNEIPEHLHPEYLMDVEEMIKEYDEKTNGLAFDRIVVVAKKPTQ